METTLFQHHITCVYTDRCIEFFEKPAGQLIEDPLALITKYPKKKDEKTKCVLQNEICFFQFSEACFVWESLLAAFVSCDFAELTQT